MSRSIVETTNVRIKKITLGYEWNKPMSITAGWEPEEHIKCVKLTTRFFCSPAMGIIRSDMIGNGRWVDEGIYCIERGSLTSLSQRAAEPHGIVNVHVPC